MRDATLQLFPTLPVRAIHRPADAASDLETLLRFAEENLRQAVALAVAAFALSLPGDLGALCDDPCGLPDDLCDTAAPRPRGSMPFAAVRLSPRECQVLAMLARGFSSKEMAQELEISLGTVKSYRRSLYQRLRITRRSDAVAAARERSLCE